MERVVWGDGMKLINADKLIDDINKLSGNRYIKEFIIAVIESQPEVDPDEPDWIESEREYTKEELEGRKRFLKLYGNKIKEMFEPIATIKHFDESNSKTIKINKINLIGLSEYMTHKDK